MQDLRLDRLDHLILTVRDVDTTCAFYQRVLRM
ncbi:MAG: VOC family virulence protein, partial [Candidatus Rokuibacteriota bacterium]